jgi:uracil-DNA glycosylase family 4
MKADEKAKLWRGISLIDDFLNDGQRRKTPAPAFNDGPLVLAGQKNAKAATERQRSAPASQTHAKAGIQGLGPVGALEALSGDSIEAVCAEAKDCRVCRLCEKRNQAVPGIGVEHPLVMVIGEGPGADEDAQGLPFVGAAGKLLDKMLAAIDLSRESNVYIANVVKCRPPMNRDPAPDEQAACARFLLRQIALLRPRYILSLGRISSHALLSVNEPMTRLRGRFYDFRGIPLLTSYHPSALLRDDDLKRPAWEDLKMLRERIGVDG